MQKTWNLRVIKRIVFLKNKSKIVYKIICVQRQSSRGVLRCPANMKKAHRRTIMQKRDHNKDALQFYWKHTHARVPSRKCSAYKQNTHLQEKTFGALFLYVKRVLKDLNYKNLLFTVVKRNLLTHKMRLVLRFLHSFYFTFRFYIKYFSPD